MQHPLFLLSTSRLVAAVGTGLVVLLSACSTVPKTASAPSPDAPAAAVIRAPSAVVNNRGPVLPAAGSGRGGYYQDDGPGTNPPDNVLAVPDAEPKIEPVYPSASKPYVVFGKTYTPIASNSPLKQRGVGSWYGKKFHGQKTASGERYDMYKMTAAHTTMPLPSYARVTNLSNGNQVIVRVNDRGPFHSGRIIDLSYTAAMKLGYVGKGSTELEVERLLPDEIARMEKSRLGERAVPQLAASSAAASRPVVVALNETIKPRATPDGMMDPPRPRYTAPEPVAVMPAENVAGSALSITDAGVAATSSSDPGLSTSSATTATTIAMASPVANSGSFYLQLGAFSQVPNAEGARSTLERDGALGLPPLEVVQAGSVFKLYTGPFSSRAEAAVAAQKIQDAGGNKPFVVQR